MTFVIFLYNNISAIINYYKPSLYSIIILYFKYNINVLFYYGVDWNLLKISLKKLESIDISI